MQTVLLVLPDFFIILLGWLLVNKLMYPASFFQSMEKLVYFILFPCLLFHSIIVAPLSFDSAKFIFLATFLLMTIGYLLAILAQPILKPRPIALASNAQCAFRFNTYLGLSLASSLGGTSFLATMAIVIGCAVPIANIYAVRALAKHQGGNFLLEIIKNPLVISTVLGIIVNLTHIPIPSLVDITINKLGGVSLVLGTLCVGASLSFSGAHKDAPLISWILVLRLLIMPLVALLLSFLLGFDAHNKQVLILFAALPPASACYILATRMGGDGRLVAFTISLGTVASIFTITLWQLAIPYLL